MLSYLSSIATLLSFPPVPYLLHVASASLWRPNFFVFARLNFNLVSLSLAVSECSIFVVCWSSEIRLGHLSLHKYKQLYIHGSMIYLLNALIAKIVEMVPDLQLRTNENLESIGADDIEVRFHSHQSWLTITPTKLDYGWRQGLRREILGTGVDKHRYAAGARDTVI